MVRISLEGVGKTPAAQTLDEHWRDIRYSLWKQLIRQEKNSTRIFYNGNHLLSPSGANIVFRCQDNQVVFAHELILKDCSPFWNDKLLPSDRRKPNNVYDYEIDAISVNKLWDPFGRIVVLLPGVKSNILKHCLQIIYCGESQINVAREQIGRRDDEDDDVNEVKKVLKDLFQIKLGENKNGDHKEDNTDDEIKTDEKISERFCLDPFSTNRWKQEFDTETNEETKEEGRARTKDEQHLSVEEFNEIRLNELNTKDVNKETNDNGSSKQLKTLGSNVQKGYSQLNRFKSDNNNLTNTVLEKDNPDITVNEENMARYNPLYDLSKREKECDSVDNVSDVIKNILGKNMKNRRLQKSPSPEAKQDNVVIQVTECSPNQSNDLSVKTNIVEKSTHFPLEEESKSDIELCNGDAECENIVLQEITEEPIITTHEVTKKRNVEDLPLEVVSSFSHQLEKANSELCVDLSENVSKEIVTGVLLSDSEDVITTNAIFHNDNNNFHNSKQLISEPKWETRLSKIIEVCQNGPVEDTDVIVVDDSEKHIVENSTNLSQQKISENDLEEDLISDSDIDVHNDRKCQVVNNSNSLEDDLCEQGIEERSDEIHDLVSIPKDTEIVTSYFEEDSSNKRVNDLSILDKRSIVEKSDDSPHEVIADEDLEEMITASCDRLDISQMISSDNKISDIGENSADSDGMKSEKGIDLPLSIVHDGYDVMNHEQLYDEKDEDKFIDEDNCSVYTTKKPENGYNKCEISSVDNQCFEKDTDASLCTLTNRIEGHKIDPIAKVEDEMSSLQMPNGLTKSMTNDSKHKKISTKKYVPKSLEPILTTIPDRFYRTCKDKTMGPFDEIVVIKEAPKLPENMSPGSKYMKFAHENAKTSLSKTMIESEDLNTNVNYFDDDSESDNSEGTIKGVSKHEDIVKRFRSRRSSRQLEDQKAQTNNDLDLKVDASNVLSNGEFSNDLDSDESKHLQEIREEEECSIIHLDSIPSVNADEGGKKDKRSYNPYNPWEQELEALRERELSSNVKRPREIILDEEDLVESTFKESYICPECGRETKNKKQLYRHAAQVHFSHQLLEAFGKQILDSGGICPFCEQELNMSSDQRNTIIVCHMGGLHEKIFDFMSDAQRQAFFHSHRIRLEYVK